VTYDNEALTDTEKWAIEHDALAIVEEALTRFDRDEPPFDDPCPVCRRGDLYPDIGHFRTLAHALAGIAAGALSSVVGEDGELEFAASYLEFLREHIRGHLEEDEVPG
jgi:hypothetical protein